MKLLKMKFKSKEVKSQDLKIADSFFLAFSTSKD